MPSDFCHSVRDGLVNLLLGAAGGRVGSGGFGGIQELPIRLFDGCDYPRMVLGPSQVGSDLHVPIGEAIFRKDREAGVGTPSGGGGEIGFGRHGRRLWTATVDGDGRESS
jgi:hypothetical protein